MHDVIPGLDEAHRRFFAGDLGEAAALGRRLLGQAFGIAADGRARDAASVADIATLLVRIARRQEQLDQAMRWARIALDAALAAADAPRECRARVQHARVLSELGQTEEALDESYAALRAAARAGTAQMEAAAREALADVQWSMAQWDDALATYRRLSELADACADLELQAIGQGGQGGIHHHLGERAEEAGEAEAAVEHFRQAAAHALEFQRCAEALGDLHSVRTAVNNQAVALMALGDTAGARASLERLLAGSRDGPAGAWALVLKNIADVDVLEGRLDEAIGRLREALAVHERLQQPHFAMVVCESLVHACEAAGDPAAALGHHRRFHALYVRVASNSAQARARAMAVKYDTDTAHAVAVAQRARADRLESRHSSLSIEAERLERLALEDALTGIGNRRRFDQVLQAAAGGGVDPAQRLSVALLDIDHFKRVNDRCSHPVGDAVLRRIGAILAANARRDDLPARYGGEEFGLVLAGLEPRAARHVCERIRQAIEAEDWRALHPALEVTISIGLAHKPRGATPPDVPRLLALADRRLYAAKHAGRNRVVDQGSEASDDEIVDDVADASGWQAFKSTGT